MYDNAGVLCFHFHISLLLCPLARCNHLNTARLKSCLYGWPEASVIPVKTFSTFKAAAADMSRQNSGRDLCSYRGRKVAKGGGEQRGGGETKWQEACSASMKSDWRTDGPTGEEVVLLSVRLEYWYTATAALPNQAKPPIFSVCRHTMHGRKNKCRHNTGRCRQNTTSPLSIQAVWEIWNSCIPTLQKRIHSQLLFFHWGTVDVLFNIVQNILSDYTSFVLKSIFDWTRVQRMF